MFVDRSSLCKFISSTAVVVTATVASTSASAAIVDERERNTKDGGSSSFSTASMNLFIPRILERVVDDVSVSAEDVAESL